MLIRRFVLTFALLTLPSFMTACAELPKSPEAEAAALEVNDPLEPMNRVIFDVNDFLDRLLIKPIAELYRFVIPDYIRERVANILSNMGEPVVFANNLMQGETTSAEITFQRFLVNTTAGVGGVFEVADDLELYKQKGDFGQTLSSWGFGSGPYLVLPLFGPSNIRDAIGLGVDTLMEPWQYVVTMGDSTAEDTYMIVNFTMSGISRREMALDEYDALRQGSLDFYAEMRSVYRQYRNKQLGLQAPDTSEMFQFDE